MHMYLDGNGFAELKLSAVRLGLDQHWDVAKGIIGAIGSNVLKSDNLVCVLSAFQVKNWTDDTYKRRIKAEGDVGCELQHSRREKGSKGGVPQIFVPYQRVRCPPGT